VTVKIQLRFLTCGWARRKNKVTQFLWKNRTAEKVGTYFFVGAKNGTEGKIKNSTVCHFRKGVRYRICFYKWTRKGGLFERWHLYNKLSPNLLCFLFLTFRYVTLLNYFVKKACQSNIWKWLFVWYEKENFASSYFAEPKIQMRKLDEVCS
jgi:hypothetical protein